MGKIMVSAGWGVLIYAGMYLAWSGLVLYGLSAGTGSLLARIVLLALLTTAATRAMRLSSMHDIAGNAVGWALIAAILDSIFLVPFTGWALYSSWSVWVGYMLIVIVPLLSRMALARTRYAEHIVA